MSPAELVLLRRWTEGRDADAFKTVAMRYAPMVYNTCRRILNNATEAEDVAQECFEDLACSNVPPRSHLGGWLHSVATNKSINRVKADNRMRARERRYSAEHPDDQEVKWDDVYTHLDEVMAGLPDRLRVPLVMSFFEEQTHEQIALALGASRGTVTYRIKKGVEALRKGLKRRGVAVASTGLTALLEQQTAEAAAAPTGLTDGISRIALAGVKGQAAGAGAGNALVTAKVAGAACALVLLAVGVYMLAPHGEPAPAPEATHVVLAATPVETEEAVPEAVTPVEEETELELPVAASEGEVETEPEPTAPSPPSIDGTWRMTLRVDDGPHREGGTLELAARGLELHVLGGDLGPSVGRLTGLNLTICLDQDLPETRGTFNPELTHITLHGIEERGDGKDSIWFVEYELDLHKLTPAEIGKLELKEQVDADIRMLFAILKRYADDHEGAFPKKLTDLVPDYLAELDMFKSNAERRVEYSPPAKALNFKDRPKRIYPGNLSEGNVIEPDGLMEYEEALQAFGFSRLLFREPLVRIVYAEPAVTLAVDELGFVSEVEEKPSEDECRKICEFNMNQLGLIARMFRGEWQGHMPPGWLTTYPEYLTNPLVLTCPDDKPLANSYSLVFPAAHMEYLAEVGSVVTGMDVEEVLQSRCAGVPMIIETHEHKGEEPGRHVVFADGEVAFMTPKEWKELIEPYLQYR